MVWHDGPSMNWVGRQDLRDVHGVNCMKIGVCVDVLGSYRMYGSSVRLHDDVPRGEGSKHELDLYLEECEAHCFAFV